MGTTSRVALTLLHLRCDPRSMIDRHPAIIRPERGGKCAAMSNPAVMIWKSPADRCSLFSDSSNSGSLCPLIISSSGPRKLGLRDGELGLRPSIDNPKLQTYASSTVSFLFHLLSSNFPCPSLPSSFPLRWTYHFLSILRTSGTLHRCWRSALPSLTPSSPIGIHSPLPYILEF